MSTAFDWWVATEIQELGGNGAEYLRCIERERALTYAETRMNTCQVLARLSDERFCSDLMRLPMIVCANEQTIH